MKKLITLILLIASITQAELLGEGLGDEPEVNEPSKPALTLDEPGQTTSSGIDRVRLDEQFQAASRMAGMGQGMAWAGLGLSIVGNVAGIPALALIGGLSNLVGIPMIGMQAGNMEIFAQQLNPGFSPNRRGWGWFWTGLGLNVISNIMIVNGVNEHNNAMSQADEDNANSTIGAGVLLGLGGTISYIVSWVKFTKRTTESRVGAYSGGMGWRLEPLYNPVDPSPNGGLRLVADF